MNINNEEHPLKCNCCHYVSYKLYEDSILFNKIVEDMFRTTYLTVMKILKKLLMQGKMLIQDFQILMTNIN